jgi:hypothetical protein
MGHPSERSPRGGLGRLVTATALFALVAPVASAAAPLAVLIVLSRPRSKAEVVVAGVAGGFSAWWLLQPGALPDQLLKATVVLTTTVFVMATVRTRAVFLHRALIALGCATVGTTVLLSILGSSWGELRWWVEHQTGLEARIVAGQLGAMSSTGTGPLGSFEQVEAWLSTMVQLAADYYPAVVTLEILAGLAVATAIYHRVARYPRGLPLGRFRLLRFSEHLGWVAVVSLAAVLVPKLAAVKLTAANILVVVGTLYALRGAAVAAFGLALAGGMNFFLWLLLAVIFLLMLPVVVGGTILLGVLDTGLDFRRRWTAPRVEK